MVVVVVMVMVMVRMVMMKIKNSFSKAFHVQQSIFTN
jgi:hypothetical protein